MRYHRRMAKTSREKAEHQHRAMLIANQMADEYGNWFGWPERAGFGRMMALGEYINELCEEAGHDEWLDAAKNAFLKWKKAHHMDTTPPLSNR